MARIASPSAPTIRTSPSACETHGDVLKGFDAAAGDLLLFVESGEDATVQGLRGDAFRVGSDAEGWERFTVAGHDNLAATDYVFA